MAEEVALPHHAEAVLASPALLLDVVYGRRERGDGRREQLPET